MYITFFLKTHKWVMKPSNLNPLPKTFFMNTLSIWLRTFQNLLYIIKYCSVTDDETWIKEYLLNNTIFIKNIKCYIECTESTSLVVEKCFLAKQKYKIISLMSLNSNYSLPLSWKEVCNFSINDSTFLWTSVH